jgi:hypothetical protein
MHLSEFANEVRYILSFLSARGFGLEDPQRLTRYAGGERVAFVSPSVEFAIVLDNRGEIDAYLSLRARPDEVFALREFLDEPSGTIFDAIPAVSQVRPPMMFGGTTSRRRALELVAEFARTYADDALRGDLLAFSRARARQHGAPSSP